MACPGALQQNCKIKPLGEYEIETFVESVVYGFRQWSLIQLIAA